MWGLGNIRSLMKADSTFSALIGNFRKLLTTSLVVALAAFGTPWLSGTSNTGEWIPVVLPLSIVWVIVVLFALVKLRARGLWLLFGTPFALYWPFLLFMLYWACAHDIKACP